MEYKDFLIKKGVLYKYLGIESKVVVPNGVVRIGHWAFSRNKIIKEIVLPLGLTSIGEEAFSYCYNLENVDFPENPIEIQNSAFRECYSLQELFLKKEYNIIGCKSFFKCTNLTKITIPENTEILNHAFNLCNRIETYFLPKKYNISVFQKRIILEKCLDINKDTDCGLCELLLSFTRKVMGFHLGSFYFPLFQKQIAIRKFNAVYNGDGYWWDRYNRIDRHNFLEFLLKNIK